MTPRRGRDIGKCGGHQSARLSAAMTSLKVGSVAKFAMGSGVDMIGPEEEGEDAGVAEFKGRHFTGEVILWAVRWYLMFAVS